MQETCITMRKMRDLRQPHQIKVETMQEEKAPMDVDELGTPPMNPSTVNGVVAGSVVIGAPPRPRERCGSDNPTPRPPPRPTTATAAAAPRPRVWLGVLSAAPKAKAFDPSFLRAEPPVDITSHCTPASSTATRRERRQGGQSDAARGGCDLLASLAGKGGGAGKNWRGRRRRTARGRRKHAGLGVRGDARRHRPTARRWASVLPLGTGQERRLRRRHACRLYQVAGWFSQNVQFTDEAYRWAVHALRAGILII
jgi:hypothetical protein